MKLKIHFTLIVMSLVFLYTSLYKEFLIFIFVITLHELGHLFMCLLFKQKVYHLNLTMVGGVLDVDIKKIKFYKELLIYISGILVNLVFLFLSSYIKNPYYSDLVFNYNLLIIIFNILPIFPLDGFRIIDLVFGFLVDPFKAYKIVTYISWIAILLLLIYAIHIRSMAFVVVVIFLSYQNMILSLSKNQYVLKKIVRQYKY